MSPMRSLSGPPEGERLEKTGRCQLPTSNSQGAGIWELGIGSWKLGVDRSRFSAACYTTGVTRRSEGGRVARRQDSRLVRRVPVLCTRLAPPETVGATTGAVEGRVIDATGAVLPGVSITAASDALIARPCDRAGQFAAQGSRLFRNKCGSPGRAVIHGTLLVAVRNPKHVAPIDLTTERDRQDYEHDQHECAEGTVEHVDPRPRTSALVE